MREIKCRICGKPVFTERPNRKYCDACSKIAYKHRKFEREMDGSLKVNLPDGTVKCTPAVSKRCIYGGTCGGYPCCNYILIEMAPRGCKPNHCDKYTTRRKGR